MSDKLKYGDIIFLNIVKEDENSNSLVNQTLGFLGSTGFINQSIAVTFLQPPTGIKKPPILPYLLGNQSFDYRESLFRVLPPLSFVYCKEKLVIEQKIERLKSKLDLLKIETEDNGTLDMPNSNASNEKNRTIAYQPVNTYIKAKLDKFKMKLIQETERLEKVNLHYVNELENNKVKVDEFRSTRITYNDDIILQHVVSGYYLSISGKNTNNKSLMKKAYLSPLIKKNVILSFSPKFKYRTINCNVHFNDDVVIKYSSKDFTLDYNPTPKTQYVRNEYNFPLRVKLLENDRPKHSLLFSGGSECILKVVKFRSGVETQQIHGGDLIRIWHVNKERHIKASYCFSDPSGVNEEVYVLKKSTDKSNFIYSVFELNHYNQEGEISDGFCCVNPSHRYKMETEATNVYIKSFVLGRNISIINGKFVIQELNTEDKRDNNIYTTAVNTDNSEGDQNSDVLAIDANRDFRSRYKAQSQQHQSESNRNPKAKPDFTFKFFSILQNKDTLNNLNVYYLNCMEGYLTVSGTSCEKFWYNQLKDQKHGYKEFWQAYEKYLPPDHIEQRKRFTPTVDVYKDKAYACEVKGQTSAENTFMVKRLSDTEVKEIYFARSFFYYLSSFRDKLVSRVFIKRRDIYKLEANTKLLITYLFTEFFDGKFNTNLKMVLCEIYKSRQTLICEYNVIELITDIIYHCNLENTDDNEVDTQQAATRHDITKNLSEVLYILINNNGKNTKCCSQWLEMFVDLTIKTSKYQIDLYIENIIIQLLRDNVQLIKYKISKATIEKFLQLILKFKKYEHIKILQSLVVCQKQLVYENQREITILLLKDPSRRHRFLFDIEHSGDAYRINYELIAWAQIDPNDLRAIDTRTNTENRNYAFFKQAVKLLSELSNSRNYLCIDILKEKYPFKLLLGFINYLDEHNYQLKIVFMRLVIKLYIDVFDYQLDAYRSSIKLLNKEIDDDNVNSVLIYDINHDVTENSIIEEKTKTKDIETLALKHRSIANIKKQSTGLYKIKSDKMNQGNNQSKIGNFSSDGITGNSGLARKYKSDSLKLFIEYNIDLVIEILKSDEIQIHAFKFIKQVLKLFKIMLETEIIESRFIPKFYKLLQALITVYIKQDADNFDISSFKKDDVKHIDELVRSIQMLIVKNLNLFIYFNFKLDLIEFYNDQTIKLTKTSIMNRFMARKPSNQYSLLVAQDVMDILIHFLNKQSLKSSKLIQTALNAIFFLNSRHNFLLKDFEASLFISDTNMAIYEYLSSYSKRLEKLAENSQRWLINDAQDDLIDIRKELNKLFEFILRSCKEKSGTRGFDPQLKADPADIGQIKALLHKETILYYINFFYENNDNKLVQLIQKISVSLPIIDSLFRILEWLFKYRHISNVDFAEDQKLIFFIIAVLMYKNTYTAKKVNLKYGALILELFERHNDFCIVLYSMFSSEGCFNDKLIKESAEFYTLINQVFKKSADESQDILFRSFNLSILALVLSSKETRKQTKIFKNLQLYMFLNIRKHFDINSLMRDSTTIEKQSRAIFEKVQLHNHSTFLVSDNLCLSFSILKLLKKFGLGTNKLTKSVCQNFYSIRSISKIISSTSVPIFYKKQMLSFMNRIYLYKENTNIYSYKDLIEHLWCELMTVIEDVLTDLSEAASNNTDEVYIATSGMFKALTSVRIKFIIKAYETIELVIRKYQDLKLTEVEQSSFYTGLTTLLEFKELAVHDKELANYFYNTVRSLKENWQSGLGKAEKAIEEQLALIDDTDILLIQNNKHNDIVYSQVSLNNKYSVKKLKTRIKTLKKSEPDETKMEENEADILQAFETKINIEYLQIINYLLKKPAIFDSTMEHILQYLIDDPDNIVKLDNSIGLLKLFRNYIEDIHDTKDCIMNWSSDFYDKNLQEILIRQNKLIGFGIIKLIVNNVEFHYQNSQIFTETLYLGIAILYGGNQKAQSELYRIFTDSDQGEFLQKLKAALDSSLEYLFDVFEKLSLSYIKRYIGSTAIEVFIKSYTSKEDLKSMETITQLIFRFLQLLCEGHNDDLQTYLRTQAHARSAINSTSINFVNAASAAFGFIIKYINPEALEIGLMILDFLIEVIQGPCILNQRQLFDDKVLDYCNDMFVELLSEDRINMKGFYTTDDKAKLHQFIIKTVKLINSLLEANEDEAISSHTINNTCIDFLIHHMSLEFRNYMSNSIPEFYKMFSLSTVRKKSSIDLLIHESNMINSVLYRYNSSMLLKNNNQKIKFRPQQFLKMINFTNFDNDLCDLFSIYFLIRYIADKNHSVSTYLDHLCGLESLALDFFKYFTGKVEIVHKNRILDFMFIIHPCCFYASGAQVNKLLRGVKRDTPKDKVKDIIDFSNKVFVLMESHCKLDHKFRKFKISLKVFERANVSVTVLGIIVNLMMLLLFKRKADGIYAIEDDYFSHTHPIFLLFGYALLAMSVIRFYLWMLVKGNGAVQNMLNDYSKELKMEINELVIGNGPGSQNIDLHDINLLKDSKDDIKKLIHIHNQLTDTQGISPKMILNFKMVSFFVNNPTLKYHILVTTCLIMAIFFDFTFLFGICLLDVVQHFSILTNLIVALTSNSKQLLLTTFLLVLVTYFYSVFGYVFLNEDFFMSAVGENICSSIFQCFLSILSLGPRSTGSIGDVIMKISYGNKEHYFIRLIYDFTVWAVINLILLNVIFGAIIDTFAALRDLNKTIDDDLNNKCIVCSLDRSTLEKHTQGFRYHVRHDHNLYHYLYFLYYLQNKDKTELSGLESYVLDSLTNNNIDWVPLLKCKSLQVKLSKQEDKDENQKVDELIHELDAYIANGKSE